ncbi:MAG: tRNA pseudouridine(55) synthase TruB [Pseudomonadota bacterium]
MTAKTDRQRRQWRDLHGILLLDKPLGISSNQALQRARRALSARKAGHTGSLDPLASGMLPLCFGDATRVSQLLLDADKTYTAVAALGQATSTGDTEGEVTRAQPLPDLDLADWQQLANGFLGDLDQVPPMYSALKHEGKRLYELARAGQAVDRPARRIHIRLLEITALDSEQLSLRVTCSKGTYIRTLVEDLAQAAGTVAHTAGLRREAVAPFVGPMHTLEALEALESGGSLPEGWLLPTDAGLSDWPVVRLSDSEAARFCQGQRLGLGPGHEPADVRVTSESGAFLGTATLEASGRLVPSRVMAGACSTFALKNP